MSRPLSRGAALRAAEPPKSLIHRNNSPKPASMRVCDEITIRRRPGRRLGLGYALFCLELLDLAEAGLLDSELMARVERYLAEGGDAKSA